ncbi:MAG TPA: glycosyltransferase, partial [Candidatus Binataceae bacterium]
MRVLHINSGKLFGGVETMLVTLARCRGLCPEMTPEFAVSFDGRFATDLTAAGAAVHRLGPVRIRYPLSVWRARRRLRDLLGRSSYDAIVCHLAWSQAIFGPVARAAGIPLVFWLHGSTSGKHWLERLASLVKPDFAFAPSRFSAATLPNLYPGVPSEVLYNPVLPPAAHLSDEERLAVRKELDTPRDAVVIVQVSRMEEGKGQRLHLQALAMLRGNPRWQCWMIGGPQQPGEDSYFKSL